MSLIRPYPSNLLRANPGKLGSNAGGPSTTLNAQSEARLFSPLAIRGVTLKNRIGVSPMCMYSAVDGFANAFHLAHLGQFAAKGAGLIIVEATGVSPNGRISPNCLGLWSQAHADALKPVVDLIHAHNAVAAIQLGHAGRKASTLSPFFTNNNYSALADEAHGGWPHNVVGPSPIKHAETTADVIELDEAGITEIVAAFERATGLALNAGNDEKQSPGFDIIELHGAHGYLIHSFLSPLSNKRSDAYGGTLENRMRFPLRVARAVRAVWPEEKPLFFRLSVSDFVEGGLTVDESVVVCHELKAIGVDLIDCSSGGVVAPSDTSLFFQPGYNVPFAEKIKKESGISTAAVGMITEAQQAEDILQREQADVILLARAFLNNSGWLLDAAAQLGAEVEWPLQYRRGKPRI
ncbi:oxidoreductase, FAD/FMN-binding protein [Chytriomyces sp. MP71]|nr:oxidoreductase, FAD/FMN-binding protein [Chytriomyces sp. MP71]